MSEECAIDENQDKPAATAGFLEGMAKQEMQNKMMAGGLDCRLA